MRIAVYSAHYGQRDPINPNCLSLAVDHDRFVCTDHRELEVPEGVRVLHDPLNGLDPHRASRRAKLRPARYFPNYDWSIYLDNNATLLVEPSELIGLLVDTGEAFFAYRHFLRNCVYQEAEACLLAGRDEPARIEAQMKAYRADGYPAENGLLAGPFLVRRHDHTGWNALGDHWFEQVLRHSRRDQLSFNYTAWKMGLTPRYLDGDLRESELVRWPALSLTQRRSDRVAGTSSRFYRLKHRTSQALSRLRASANRPFQ